jgi:HAD superfamily hydrolase (TIGR01509 family)
MEYQNEIHKLIDRYQYIIFDMDGVIVNSEPLKYQAYQKTFMDHYHIALDSDDVSWRGKPEADVMNFWLEKANISDDADVEHLIAYKRKIYSTLLSKGQVNLVSGIVEFLSFLISQGKQLGLATTSNKDDQQAIFNTYFLEKYFSTITTLDDVHFPKPNPEIYLKTAGQLKTRPENCLVFEDSPSGVRAAQSVGMQVICVLTSYQKSDFKDCCYFLNGYVELLLR